jgi:hypothetical protein
LLSCVQMWEGLIQKAKDGGLDVIQTYVFWNGHEPTPGNVKKITLLNSSIELLLLCHTGILMVFSCVAQYYFEERYDLVRFIKTVQKAGMFVHLRIGPYICGEWNFGYSSHPEITAVKTKMNFCLVTLLFPVSCMRNMYSVSLDFCCDAIL